MTVLETSCSQRFNLWDLSQHNHGTWHYVKGVAGPVVAGLVGGVPGCIFGAAMGLLVAHRGNAAHNHEVANLKKRIVELEDSKFQSDIECISHVNETYLHIIKWMYHAKDKPCPSFPKSSSARAEMEKSEAAEKTATGSEKAKLRELILVCQFNKLIEISNAVRVLYDQSIFEVEISEFIQGRCRLLEIMQIRFNDSKISLSEEDSWNMETNRLISELEDYRLAHSDRFDSFMDVRDKETDIRQREEKRYKEVAYRVDALRAQEKFENSLALTEARRKSSLAHLKLHYNYRPEKSNNQWREEVKMKEKLDDLLGCRVDCLCGHRPDHDVTDKETAIQKLVDERNKEVVNELDRRIRASNR